MSLERSISEHVAQCRYEDLPEAASLAARYSILDTLGVMLAATSLSEDCGRIAEFARECGGNAESSVIGFGDRLPAPAAALVNGALCHPLDFDDVHDEAKCHPAAESFPAALALAERVGASGKELLTAMAVGGDVAARIALSVDLGPGSHGWLGSAIYSHFGATAAAGKILGLSADQMSHAFGIAFCQTAGSHEMAEDCAYRGVRDGFAQKVGVVSAMLAQRGVTGPSAFLEGKAGLYRQYFQARYTPERLVRDLGSVFEAANVSYKLWPSCRLTHNYIQSLLAILDENGLAAEDVEQVAVVVSEWGQVLCEPESYRLQPTTAMGAKDSMQFTLGAVLAHRSVRMEHFEPAGLEDAAILKAARKVVYTFDPGLDPAGMSPGDVRVRTRDGREVHKVVEFLYGSPRNPIEFKDLEGKFRDCVSHAARPLAAGRADKLVADVLDLDRAASVDCLIV